MPGDGNSLLRVQREDLENSGMLITSAAKGIGEATLTPTAPAIANAVADAVGVSLDELPLTPERVLAAIARGEV